MVWTIKKKRAAAKSAAKKKNPLLLVGLPGIGNVGKIAIDYMINTLNAKPLCTFHSSYLPASVVINEDSLISLPGLMISVAQTKKHTLYFLHGDMQPIDDFSSHEFAKAIIQWAKKQGIQQIISTGGIGLKELPKSPRLFLTAADKRIIKKMKKFDPSLHTDLYGYVGPIIGVVGLLVVYAYEQKIPAMSLLVETHNHPFSFSIMSAKKLLEFFSSYLTLSFDLSALEKEITVVEQEILRRLQKENQIQKKKETDYIG